MKSENQNKKILLRKKHEKLKRERGITLIALVITIIVLLILAGVSIAMLTGENGILSKAGDAKDKTNKETVREQVQMEVYGSYDDNGNFDMGQLRKNIEKNLNVSSENINDAENDDGIEFNKDGVKVHVTENGEVLLEGETAKNPSNPNKPTGDSEQVDEPQPGEWDGTVNAPKLEEGMTKVDGSGNEVEDTEENPWYDYEQKKWANAKTEDGSMWVWIPRFEYKITSKPTSSNEAGTIDVKFIATDKTDPTETDYIVHPAFTSDVENGGWRSEIPGFWVAKYEMSMEKYGTDNGWQHANTTSKTDGNVATSSAEEIAKPTNDAKRMVSKPGVSSWRYINISKLLCKFI